MFLAIVRSKLLVVSYGYRSHSLALSLTPRCLRPLSTCSRRVHIVSKRDILLVASDRHARSLFMLQHVALLAAAGLPPRTIRSLVSPP
ncbi:hypothetical protein MA16_Dca001963 [Dendrobium catenatum]|uniref:Uncharacterized protein n=1 Tax=Dendrobium catenatum TaxID=906689 RepID=A0A2I0XE00_9ASPA|nr:hypothetical protein MA16_Dca001963 [Dendrobium catenatum]